VTDLTWIRVDELGEAGLTTEEKITAIAMLLEEHATCTALQLIHGPAKGYARYLETGGHVHYDVKDRPVVALEDIRAAHKERNDRKSG
jgi:hypothetical protein